MKLLTLILLAGFAAIEAATQERYVKPVDEASLDPSFGAFRSKVIAAAERRDAGFMLSILDPKIHLSFGGDEGIADFRRIWKIHTKGTRFWTEFLPVIKNGGAFVRENGRRTNLFYAPYTFNSFPEDLDAFEYHAIFGFNVNLRKEPRMSAQVAAKLSYNVVRIEPENLPKSGRSEYPGWWRVRTLGGLDGYVKKEYVRSPIDYRAGFEKKRGHWKMVAFIAGD